ncbi:UNVERIFIED_CONTAM: Phosphoglycerate kinase, cytosolic [Sesamum radiatum]|uniref:phosphoglycerate kinase n=1 Tax=Sesamum radiatum TaxID=300843 RepID=A0AAW2TLL4_SESRA
MSNHLDAPTWVTSPHYRAQQTIQAGHESISKHHKIITYDVGYFSISYSRVKWKRRGVPGFGCGPDSIKSFGEALKTTKTIIWNGPMGVRV